MLLFLKCQLYSCPSKEYNLPSKIYSLSTLIKPFLSWSHTKHNPSLFPLCLICCLHIFLLIILLHNIEIVLNLLGVSFFEGGVNTFHLWMNYASQYFIDSKYLPFFTEINHIIKYQYRMFHPDLCLYFHITFVLCVSLSKFLLFVRTSHIDLILAESPL